MLCSMQMGGVRGQGGDVIHSGSADGILGEATLRTEGRS